MAKVNIYHFHNGSGGGVLSVIRNLVAFSNNPAIENHIIYTINKKKTPLFCVPELPGSASQEVFYYSPSWNYYFIFKQLAKLLPDQKAIIIAHDWLELGMASSLGLQNGIIQFLHGDFDYYYGLAVKHEPSIDKFITVSSIIERELKLKLTNRYADIQYLRFPVPSVAYLEKKNKRLKIMYCVRDLNDHRKQFKLLPLIQKQLLNLNVEVIWTIIGGGMSMETFNYSWGPNQLKNVNFLSSLPNDTVLKLLPEHDLFLLPSLAEGFPVAVVEAMKAGVVPLVTDWNGATDELIINEVTGYTCPVGDHKKYALTIGRLNNRRDILYDVSKNASNMANKLFNPFINTNEINELMTMVASVARKRKTSYRSYGSRLDKMWIPNFITTFLRNWLSKKK